jgi:hypothetical protein
MRQDERQRLHNIVSKPLLKYGSEMHTFRTQDKKGLATAYVGFMRPMFGVILRDKVRSENIRTQLE